MSRLTKNHHSNINGHESARFNTKFDGNRSTGSGEEDSECCFTLYGRGAHLSHVTQTFPLFMGAPNEILL